MGGWGGQHKHNVYHYILVQNYSAFNAVARWSEHHNLVT